MDLKSVLNEIQQQINDVFDFGPKTIIGIDIGQRSVKAAVVSSDKKGLSYKIEYFKKVKLSEGAIIEDEFHKEDEIIDAIKEVVSGVGKGVNKVCVGLGGQNTISRLLKLAGGTEEEIDDQVSWEAEQYIPFDLDDCTISYHIVGENEGGGADVIVVAATNMLVEKIKYLIGSTGLKLKIVDLTAIADLNVFRYLHPEVDDDENTVILMDIGAQNTHFMILRNGYIVSSKEISRGGVNVTDEIQRREGVKYEDAENLKIKGDGNGNLPQEIVSIVNDVNREFLTEVKKTVEFYVTQSSDDSCSKIYITGGGAKTPGLTEGLEKILGLPVEFLDPLAAFEYSKKLKDSDLEDIRSEGVAALGLAMRKIK